MRFDELASKAGRAAADIGHQAERPPLPRVLAGRRRRALIAGLASAAAVLVMFAVLSLWLGSGSTSPPDAAATTATSSAASSTTSGATTTPDEATVPEVIDGGRAACRVTVPGAGSFAPAADAPDGPPPSYEAVWYGTPELWTMVHHEGEIWTKLPVAADGSLTQKTFWWIPGLVLGEEPEPNFTVTAERIDGSALSVEADPGNNGSHPELGVFIVVGLQIPQPGCWQITAEYRGTSVSYVAWVDNETA